VRAQVLSTRARKDVKVADIKVQVCLFAFDCLYLDGRVLLQRPLTERRAALYSAVGEQPGELLFAVAKARRAGPERGVLRVRTGKGALRRQGPQGAWRHSQPGALPARAGCVVCVGSRSPLPGAGCSARARPAGGCPACLRRRKRD